MSALEVKVPAIGDYKDVPVIDVLVKAGDAIAAGDPLVTLESEKATLDVPSPAAGTVKELRVGVGDRVSEGSVVVTLEPPEPGAGDDVDSDPSGSGRVEAVPLQRRRNARPQAIDQREKDPRQELEGRGEGVVRIPKRQ